MAEDFDDFDVPDSPQVSPADGTAPPPTGEGDSGSTGASGLPAGSDAYGDPLTSPKPTSTTDAAEPWPHNLTQAFRNERLPVIPGETAAAASLRLSDHLIRKNREFRAQSQETAQRLAEIQRTVQLWEPMLRDYYRRQQSAAQEEQLAQIPDPDTDPQGYQTWLLEDVLRRDEERRIAEARSIEEAQRVQVEAARAAELRAVDEYGYGLIAQGLGLDGSEADPEFSVAYDTLSGLAMASAADYFPDATPQQIQEFVGLSQLLDVRRMTAAGLDIREVMKSRVNGLIDNLVRAGIVTRAQARQALADQAAGAGQGASAGNGSGRPAAAPPPTANRVAADALAAARRSPLATPGGGRPAGSGGGLPDPEGMDEDDFVEAALSGILGNAEQRIEKHRRQR